MNIQEILMLAPHEIHKELTSQEKGIPEWSNLEKFYEPSKHRILHDPNRIKKANIAIGLQKLLARRMGQMLFSIPIQRIYYPTDATPIQQEIIQSIEKIYEAVKINSVNRDRSQDYYGGCEVATVWGSKEKDNLKYGFDSKLQLRTNIFSQKRGDALYPYFDDTDDLIAFSIGYTRKEGEVEINCLQIYTAERVIILEELNGSWTEVSNDINELGKIPVIYENNREAFYNDINILVEHIEKNISNNSDIIDYNSAPVLMVRGEILGELEEKGKSQRVMQVTPEGL